MIVRNWMEESPVAVESGSLLSEASRILTESNTHALPVVDGGRLRGLVTRANVLRLTHFVGRTQDSDEFAYFTNRVKVKDVMLRNPATVQADDTVEYALRKGQALGVSQFPVLEDGRVVGMISAREIYALAAHFLGALEDHQVITLAPLVLRPGVMARITEVAERAGAEVHSVYPVRLLPGSGADERRAIVRLRGGDTAGAAAALSAAGFPVTEEPPRGAAMH